MRSLSVTQFASLSIAVGLILGLAFLAGKSPNRNSQLPQRGSLVGADPTIVRNGAIRYVAQSGNDSGTCLDQAQACRQISYAIKKAQSGDTILVGGGIYNPFEVGTDGLTIQAQDPKNKPVIDWHNEIGEGELIRVHANNVVIDGMTGYKAFYVGLRVFNGRGVPGSNITIRNCVFGDNGELGIMTNDGASNLLLEKNITYGSKVQHGIYIANDAHNVIVQNNIAYNNADAGLQFNGGDGSGMTNIIVRNNTVYGNGEVVKEGAYYGARSHQGKDLLRRLDDGTLVLKAGAKLQNGPGIYLAHVRDATVVNNLFYNNYRGIVTLESGGSSGSGLKIYNNTVVMAVGPVFNNHPVFGRGEWTRQIVKFDSSSNIRMYNNILYGPEASAPSTLYGKNMDSDYNVFHDQLPKGEGSHSQTVASEQDLFRDPTNADLAQRDYHLIDKTKINKGVAVSGLTEDLAGAARSNPPTIGAFEGKSGHWVETAKEDCEDLDFKNPTWQPDKPDPSGDFTDDGRVFHKTNANFTPPAAYRISLPFSTNNWLTIEAYSRSKKDPTDLFDIVQDPGNSNNCVLKLQAKDSTDAAIVRTSNALPSRYKISVRVGYLDVGTGTGTNGYVGNEKNNPWTFGSDNATDENGAYFSAIFRPTPSSGEQPKPHNNVLAHYVRSFFIDSDNNTGNWTNIWNGQKFIASGVHPIMIGATDGAGKPQGQDGKNGYPFYSFAQANGNNGDALLLRRQPAGSNNAADAYLPGQWYTVTFERFDNKFTMRITGKFKYGGETSYEANVNDAVAQHILGFTDPQYWVSGIPHINYYRGVMYLDDLRLSTWQE